MGFKSLFPFFNRDEVTPSELDINPDVQSIIGRVLARNQGFSNILGVFKFIRSDYNGKLHVSEAPTDFDNYRFADVAVINGTATLSPPNPDRQEIWLQNLGPTTPTIAITIGADVVWQYVIPVGAIDIFRGITGLFTVTNSAASGVIRIWDI